MHTSRDTDPTKIKKWSFAATACTKQIPRRHMQYTELDTVVIDWRREERTDEPCKPHAAAVHRRARPRCSISTYVLTIVLNIISYSKTRHHFHLQHQCTIQNSLSFRRYFHFGIGKKYEFNILTSVHYYRYLILGICRKLSL